MKKIKKRESKAMTKQIKNTNIFLSDEEKKLYTLNCRIVAVKERSGQSTMYIHLKYSEMVFCPFLYLEILNSEMFVFNVSIHRN